MIGKDRYILTGELKVLNSKDLQELFGFGKTKMNQVLQSGILPVIKIGGEYRTTEEQIREWFKRNVGKEIII
ncbi:MAG: hypothetical protein K0S41_2172 [Anaerocolumna sp.]|jgi:hypothetical protein|nr:hypothetical protein [Anaerocolumna sp.]